MTIIVIIRWSGNDNYKDSTINNGRPNIDI